MYGGASLNALHALMQALSGVLPRDGRLPEPLRAGIVSPSASELEGWKQLPAGAAEIAAAGSRPGRCRGGRGVLPAHLGGAVRRRERHRGGSPTLQKTVIAVEAEANVSIRLVADQDPDVIIPAFERLLREAAPAGAEVEFEVWSHGAPRTRARRRAGGSARPRRVRGGARRPAAARPLRRRDPARLRARHAGASRRS